MNHASPARYCTQAKADGRSAIWDAVEQVRGTLANATIGILESSAGEEAALLQRRKVEALRIHTFNFSSGVCGWASRKLREQGYQKIVAHAKDIVGYVVGHPRMFDIIGYDTCGTITNARIASDLPRLLGNVNFGGLVYLNTTAYHDSPLKGDAGRFAHLCKLIEPLQAEVVGVGRYVNKTGKGSVPMMWYLLRSTRGTR